MDRSRVSIGVMGSMAPDTLRVVAPAIEAAGFRGLWVNEGGGGDSLDRLRLAASVTRTLHLASGVIPLDNRPAPEILQALDGIPTDRLTIGVGSGGPKNALERVGDGVRELRGGTDAQIVVGALGPRMRRLAAEAADGVLLSWLPPQAAAAAMDDLHRAAGDRPVRGILYARTVADPAALPSLIAESAAYESYPSYAANFERLGVHAIDGTIDGTDPGHLEERIRDYIEVVDELVLRAVVPEQTVEAYLDFVAKVSL
jgi:alkanesulfonate monooxygenase SsuD/methylene tetrahydromethanopterin reductase-like flavin-dependent oxidoreductase (luciferase family)